ncbi:Mitochondrial import receptor subunit TOM70, partial [Cyphomyrmex costatus]
TPLQTTQKYKNAGNVHFNTGKYNEAIAQYNKAIDICPKENVDDLAILYQNRAAAYEKLKRYNFVKADCSKALELNPRYIKALLRRARILVQLGDLEAALKDITTVCIYKNFSDETLLLKAKMILDKLVEHIPECTTHPRFYMPTTHIIEIYYIKTFCKDPILSRLKYPENIPEFFKKPLQALKNKEYQDIIPLCTEIIESSNFDTLPPSKLEVLLLRATFYFFWMNYNAAINDFEMILSSKDALRDIRVNALIKRANLHQEIKLQHLAFIDFELAIIINPSCCDIYYHRGLAYLRIDRFDEAKRDFDTAIEYNPNFSAAHMRKLHTNYYFALLNRDICLAEITVRAIEKAFDKYSNSPECVGCYILYAQVQKYAQQYQKADTYFIKAIEKNPDYAIAYLILWNCNLDDIEKYMNKALKLETCSVEGKTTCIEILRIFEIKRGNVKKAIKLSEKALAFCRTFKEMLYMYSVDIIHIYGNFTDHITYIIHFLQSYSRFIDTQNAEVTDKHISIDIDGPSKLLFLAAESEVKTSLCLI